jgi:hypothetical protein
MDLLGTDLLGTDPARLMRPSGTHDARDLARLVEDGLVRVVAGDVHVAVDLPDSRAVRAGAALALIPDRLLAAGAAVSGPDAVWLHAGGPAPERIHLTLPVGRGRSGAEFVVAHEGRLTAQDVVVLDGVPVTVPARAAADVARLVPGAQARCLLHRLGAAVDVDPRDALVHLERLGGCRGVETARRTVLAWAGDRAPARRWQEPP